MDAPWSSTIDGRETTNPAGGGGVIQDISVGESAGFKGTSGRSLSEVMICPPRAWKSADQSCSAGAGENRVARSCWSLKALPRRAEANIVLAESSLGNSPTTSRVLP